MHTYTMYIGPKTESNEAYGVASNYCMNTKQCDAAIALEEQHVYEHIDSKGIGIQTNQVN